MVVFGQSGCDFAKVDVFLRSGFSRLKWFHSSKVVIIGQKWLYSGKVVVFRQKWLYSGKVVVFMQKW